MDEAASIEQELQSYGINKPQMHTLTNSDKSLGKHHLYNVERSLQQGVIKTGDIAVLVGVVATISILLVSYLLGWHTGPLSGMPVIIFALIVLAFCSWEGDHIGIQLPHINSSLFKTSLENGKTILFIDVEQTQELAINKIMISHPNLKPEGIATATPEWLIHQQNKYRGLLK